MVGTDSHRIPRVPCYLGTGSKESTTFSPTGLSPSVATLSRSVRLRCEFVTPRRNRTSVQSCPTTPVVQRMRALTYDRFGLFPFRSPLLGESHSFSFPGATKMFQLAPLALPCLCVQQGVSRHYSGWVAPFGDPRITGCLLLPEAYRSLPRPSSPASAKASTVCP